VVFSLEAERIDKWLWAVRIFRTRSRATDACRAGSVTVNSQPVKPSRDVRPGEVVIVRQGLIHRTLRVRAMPPARVGAKLVATYCEDQTPPAEFAKAPATAVENRVSLTDDSTASSY